MSTVIDQNRSILAQPMSSMAVSAAANDDHLPGNGRAHEASDSGWNAHDVWRRFIKEARDCRKTQNQLPQ